MRDTEGREGEREREKEKEIETENEFNILVYSRIM